MLGLSNASKKFSSSMKLLGLMFHLAFSLWPTPDSFLVSNVPGSRAGRPSVILHLMRSQPLVSSRLFSPQIYLGVSSVHSPRFYRGLSL